MAFEKKILRTLSCPRCNGIAEIRIERPAELSDSKRIFLYTTCKTCRLRRYESSTTEKALKYDVEIQKLLLKIENLPVNSSARYNLLAKIENMQRAKARSEIGL